MRCVVLVERDTGFVALRVHFEQQCVFHTGCAVRFALFLCQWACLTLGAQTRRNTLTCAGLQHPLICAGMQHPLTCAGMQHLLTCAGMQLPLTCAGMHHPLTCTEMQHPLTCVQGCSTIDLCRDAALIDMCRDAALIDLRRHTTHVVFSMKEASLTLCVTKHQIHITNPSVVEENTTGGEM